MIFTLRPYQQEAVDATLNHFRRHKTPAVIVLPTGAGKSLVIAELARLARGRVLVLAHVKELVAQNHAKYQALGLEADIFAAGLKRKESHGKVVFGSVQSVARNLDAFQGEFSLLIVDECHRIGDDEESQYQQILTHLTKVNPHLRLLGLTATPFRLGMFSGSRAMACRRLCSKLSTVSPGRPAMRSMLISSWPALRASA